MKILYHHRTRAGDAQGVHIRELVEAFHGLGHETHLASLIAPERTAAASTSSSRANIAARMARTVPYLYEILQCGYNMAALPWLLWTIARWKPDFIYERYSLFNFAGVLAAALTRTPLVLEVNSPLALEQYLEREIRAKSFSLWMENLICNAAARVVVVSSPLRRILAAQGVEESKLEVISNGVNIACFDQSRDAEPLRRKLGLTERTVIGFVGWFRKWHRVDLLMAAFARAALDKQGATLLLVGDGPETPFLRATAEDLGIEQHVIFTGPIQHAEIPSYLALIDIAVQPAANEYCCPMKILEYMALGKAIVAPRQENIGELVGDGREAALFSPGDADALAEALRVLVADPGRRQVLGANARHAIEKRGLLWTQNAQRVIDMIAGGISSINRGEQSARLQTKKV